MGEGAVKVVVWFTKAGDGRVFIAVFDGKEAKNHRAFPSLMTNQTFKDNAAKQKTIEF
jgi:hypothetical protein